MTLLRTAMLVSAFAWLGASAVRAEESPFVRTGVYVGASMLMGVENFDDSVANNLAGGFDLRIGYRATSVFSFEIDGAYLYRFEYAPGQRDLVTHHTTGQPPNLLSSSQEGFETQVSLWQITANIKANGNLARFGENYFLQRFQPYGLFGLGVYNAHYTRFDTFGGDYDNTDAVAKLGVGLDYYVTESIAIALEADYNFLFNGSRRLDYFGFSLGAFYRF
jgi:opacity protein-like surface antigen